MAVVVGIGVAGWEAVVALVVFVARAKTTSVPLVAVVVVVAYVVPGSGDSHY